MDSDKPDKKKPKKLEGGGNGGKPPRRTAVGAGGPGDESDDANRDLKRFDLDNPDDSIDANELSSWSLPSLSFFQLRHGGVTTNGNINEMEGMLTALHTLRANHAFLMLGRKTCVDSFIGFSLPVETEAGETTFVTPDRLNAVFEQLGEGLRAVEDTLSADSIATMIEPGSKYVGCVTGIPAFGSTGGEIIDSLQVDRLASGLKGNDYGVLVLAAPVPPGRVALEESKLLEQIRSKTESEDPQLRRRAKYFVESGEAYLKELQSGAERGMWLVGVYYFAPNRSTFMRLQSLFQATYVDETIRQAPLRLHEIDRLDYHLKRFGLLRTPRSNQSFPSLHAYKFLTPLDSRRLAVYVNVPARV